MIDYWSSDTTLEYKMEIMKMTNELNVNHKVGIIYIRLNYNNPISTEIIGIMTNNCNNVYNIGLCLL